MAYELLGMEVFEEWSYGDLNAASAREQSRGPLQVSTA